jgi:hypothetical protein
MDATITYDEVVALLETIPSPKPCPNFERIRVLRRHFERALQCLPCPQSTLHGWKGMVMARELYALLTPTAFCLPTNPGPNVVYVQAIVNIGNALHPAPLTCTEQATIDMTFTRRKHYFLSMRNIERACFTAPYLSVNNTFKVSNDPATQGWHAGTSCMFILDQLSEL